jgi:PAS domain S-box-containing protein
MINFWVRGEIVVKKNNNPVEYAKKMILAVPLRIIFPLCLTFILFAVCMFLLFIPSLKKHLINQKKEMIHELNGSSCSLTWSLLSGYNLMVLSGELTLEDAQARAIKRIRHLRYGPENEDYFVIIDKKNKVILHPSMPYLEGRDQTNVRDANGKYIYVAFVKAAQMKGSGYVDYLWQGKAYPLKKVPKIAYVKLFEPWGWVIGTSIYVDEIHSKIQVITQGVFKTFAGILSIVLILSVYISWQAMKIGKKGHQAEKAHRLDSLRLKKLRELNQMAEASLEDLVAFSLEEAIKLTRSRIGYLVFLNDDETALTLHTWSKDSIMKCNVPDKERIYQMEQTGLWGDAVRQRRAVIINDYKNMDSGQKKGYPKGHVKIIRHMNIPVFDGGKIVAVAGVGNKKENYNKSDVRQLNLLMDGMWKIIHRKRSEVALRKSEERYRLLTENISDNIWTLQLSDMCLTYVSPSIEKIMGYKPEQILNLSFKDFMTQDSFKKLSMVVSEELKKENEPGSDPKRSRVIPLEQVRKDGSLVWTEITTCFLRDEAGKADRILGVTRDITERRQMERKLQQSQKMEAIGTLAGGIAHDFNNILSSILGFTELAKMRCTNDPAMKEKLDKIFASGIRARDLVRHILVFSRQQEVHRESIFIVPLLKECMGFLRASIPRNIEIVQDCKADGCTVMADASQIHQIIMNLCTNAAHSMRGKNGLLEVRLKQVEIEGWEGLPAKGLKQGRYLKLTVADSGCGIPKQIVERIFEPFFTTKGCGEGTGMGLSIVHGIIKDMGGAICVYSEPGKGTAFQVFFPVHRCRATDMSPSVRFLTKGTGRILLVDDEENIVISGRLILMTMGYDVVGVTCSLEALDLFKKEPDRFDLVLTDVTMPKMTGIALSKEVLKIRKDIPIVLMTGFSEGVTSQIENIGAFGMVMKPVIARELAEVIHTALGA